MCYRRRRSRGLCAPPNAPAECLFTRANEAYADKRPLFLLLEEGAEPLPPLKRGREGGKRQKKSGVLVSAAAAISSAAPWREEEEDTCGSTCSSDSTPRMPAD
jgi:hypothetical protein